MPERRADNRAKWTYPARFPGMDMRMDENAVDPRLLVEAVGVDGRFEGSIRTFPGFGDAAVHGVPRPVVGVTTIGTINNIQGVWYASIRKGTSPYSLRGLVLFGDNQTGTGRALYFSYRDSQTGTSDVVMLEDFRDWNDVRPDTFEEIDVSYLGRYVYCVVSGNVVTTVSSWTGKAAPYNKAYYYDFKINPWDLYVGGIRNRFLGLLPERTLIKSVNSDKVGLSSDVMDNQIASTITQQITDGREYTLGAEIISQKHKLRSFFRMRTKRSLDTPFATLRWLTDFLKLPYDLNPTTHNQLLAGSSTVSVALAWGLSHMDGVRLWRTLGNDTGLDSGKYSTVQRIYKVREYEPLLQYTQNDPSPSWTWTIDIADDTTLPETRKIEHIPDGGLETQFEYDPIFEEFGPAPRMKRLIGFDGLLIGVTDGREPTAPDEFWRGTDRVPEAICWSAIHLNEPENFPTLNYEELDDPSEHVLSLHAGSSAAFAVTNMGIYRIVRAGTSLSMNRIAYPVGGISRYSQIAVGDTVYVVTRSGIREVDGNTGEIRSVKLLNRLVFDDKRWAASLSSVRLGYDSYAGALILLNTQRKEMVLLWETTGAVTMIHDAPWLYIANGPDVLTDNGGNRAYLVDTYGQIHTVDAFRQSGKVAMFGASLTTTVNGAVTTGSSTQIIDSTASFSTGCRGFSVYILSGARSGTIATITAVTSGTILTVSGLPGTLAVGDRYSVGPVFLHLRWPRLSGVGDDDPFVRKITASVSASLQDLGGETSVSAPNAFIRLGMHNGSQEILGAAGDVRIRTIPDQVVARANAGGMKIFPFLECRAANVDFEVDAILVRGQLSASEAESSQGSH